MEPELKPKYRNALDGISQIPSLPSLVSRIISVLNNQRSNAEDVSRLLEMDVGLSSKVLRLANSSYYSPVGDIASVHRAIIHLGFNTVSSIVISASAFNLFRNPENPVNLNRIAFWRHSISVALNARVFATFATQNLDPEIAFTQGMLHDLGALVLESQFPQEYATLLGDVRRKGGILHQVEKDYFGMDHGEVGSQLLARWGIPDVVRIPIQDHHHLDAMHGFQKYTEVLALADYLAHRDTGSDFPERVSESFPFDETLMKLGITSTEQDWKAAIEEEHKKAKLVMNLLRS